MTGVARLTPPETLPGAVHRSGCLTRRADGRPPRPQRTSTGWSGALSITTAVPKSGRPRPYGDQEGGDGLHRYKLRRDQGGTVENESLDPPCVMSWP